MPVRASEKISLTACPLRTFGLEIAPRRRCLRPQSARIPALSSAYGAHRNAPRRCDMLDQRLKASLPIALLAFLLGGPVAAHAADLDEGRGPYRAPPPYAGPYEPSDAPRMYAPPPPVMHERYGGNFERCRLVNRVWMDPYGRQVLRPIRVCEEPAAYRAPRWVAAPPPYGYGSRASGYGPRLPPYAAGPGPQFDDE